MTTAELIQKLQTVPPNTPVLIWREDRDEINGGDRNALTWDDVSIKVDDPIEFRLL